MRVAFRTLGTPRRVASHSSGRIWQFQDWRFHNENSSCSDFQRQEIAAGALAIRANDNMSNATVYEPRLTLLAPHGAPFETVHAPITHAWGDALRSRYHGEGSCRSDIGRGIWRSTDGDHSETKCGIGRNGSRLSAAEHARHGRGALRLPRAQARGLSLPQRNDLTILPQACVAVATRVSAVSTAGR
jgi:hypothetical protein